MSKEANPLLNKRFETTKNSDKGIAQAQLNGEIQRNRASAAMGRVLKHGSSEHRENRLSFLKRFRISL